MLLHPIMTRSKIIQVIQSNINNMRKNKINIFKSTIKKFALKTFIKIFNRKNILY